MNKGFKKHWEPSWNTTNHKSYMGLSENGDTIYYQKNDFNGEHIIAVTSGFSGENHFQADSYDMHM